MKELNHSSYAPDSFPSPLFIVGLAPEFAIYYAQYGQIATITDIQEGAFSFEVFPLAARHASKLNAHRFYDFDTWEVVNARNVVTNSQENDHA